MAEKLDALRKLLAKVETGETYATMGHTLLCQKAFPKPADFDGSPEAYSSSNAQQAILAWRNGDLNAAKALHEVVLPGWLVTNLGQSDDPRFWWCSILRPVEGDDDGNITLPSIHVGSWDQSTPARAWLIAILKALIAEAGDE